MRHRVRTFLIGLATAVVVASTVFALHDSGVMPKGVMSARTLSPYEVLVFQRAPCVYCDVFRRDVLPRYRDGQFATAAPIRFIDIDTDNIAALGLATPLTVLPTAVVMKDGAEFARIPGYTGPETFFRLMSHILPRTQ
jgi:thioredoxin-related protein